MKAWVVPLIVGVLGTMPKTLKTSNEFGIQGRTKNVLTMVLL